jgi:hypothetical protein
VLLIKQACFSITCGGNTDIVIVGNVGVVVAKMGKKTSRPPWSPPPPLPLA